MNAHPLDFDAIVSESITAAGSSDFGSRDDLAAFRILLRALMTEAELTPQGVAAKRASTVRALTNRLRLRQALAYHPDIAKEPISGPVVIVGLPRSGTTKLHRMIASDPGMQKLPLWKILNPVPPRNEIGGEADRRLEIARAYEAAMREQQPGVYAAHPMMAQEPDEDVFALEPTGRVYINCTTANVPSYRRWLDEQPFDEVYEWLRLILQTVQYFDHARGKPWVLKAPHHMGFLPVLFKVFPEATLVHCHRRPAASIASYCAMVTAARKAISDNVDATEVGRYGLEFLAGLMPRYLRDRALLEKQHRFVDIRYRDIVDRAPETADRIYEAAGILFLPKARKAMREWEDRNGQHKHGLHRYALSDSGLSEQDVDRAFAEYCARFSAYF